LTVFSSVVLRVPVFSPSPFFEEIDLLPLGLLDVPFFPGHEV